MIRSGTFATLAVLCAVTGSVGFTACGHGHPSPEEAKRTVSLQTAGGVAFDAVVHPGRRDNPAGLVLVSGGQGQPSDWSFLATHLQQEGFTSILPALPARENDADPEATLARIRAAFDALPGLGASRDDRGIVGIGAGATLALMFAAEQPDVQAVVLVSPGLVLDGLHAEEALARLTHTPTLFIATEGDAYASESAHTLKRAARGFSELREYSGAASGSDIFTSSESALTQVAYWLQTILLPHRPAPAAPAQ